MLRLPIITALTISVWLSASAFAMERYSIAGISTQATGESATEARMTALEQAEAKAFQKLMAELLGEDVPTDNYPAADAMAISSMVSGYAIDSETVGTTSYKATLAVHFDQQRVDRFLNRSSSTLSAPQTAEAPSQYAPEAYNQPSQEHYAQQPLTTLVVPLLRTGTGPMVWDDPNPWKQAWNTQPLQEQGVILPLGDLDDVKNVSAERVANIDWDALHALERRYPAGRIVIADAALVQSDIPGMLNLTVTMHDSSRAITPAPSFTIAGPEANKQMFAQAMYKMLDMIRGQGQHAPQQFQAENSGAVHGTPPANLSRDMHASQIKVLVPVTNIQQWIKMRAKIQSLGNIQKVRVVAITPSQADVILTHAGSTDSLQQALQSQGMKLTQQNSFWILRETI